MKAAAAPKLQKLDTVEMESEFFSGSALIGIQSQDAAYHLCWKINEHMDFDFFCDPDTFITYKTPDGLIYFPVFQYVMPNSNSLFLLYQLKRSKIQMLGNLKRTNWLSKADYLWMHKTTDPAGDANRYVARLRAIPGVQYAGVVDQDQIKLLNNLIV